jgi:hypothetical protein
VNFLIDHNLRGHAVLLSGCILSGGWLDWVIIRFITFDEMKLPSDSDDRVVWQLAQSNQMILLTANRSMKDENSLEQLMREEITPTSLPVVTIGNADRLLNDPEDRERCATRLVEIVLDIDGYTFIKNLSIDLGIDFQELSETPNNKKVALCQTHSMFLYQLTDKIKS